MEYLHHFSGIGPHPESVTISTDYNSIIDELLNTTTDPVTIKTLERIRDLLNHIERQGFINVKLACIIMEFIPGQTLWEVQQKLGLSQTDASMSLLIVTMSQIIDLLFTHGYVLIDCHQKNVQKGCWKKYKIKKIFCNLKVNSIKFIEIKISSLEIT